VTAQGSLLIDGKPVQSESGRTLLVRDPGRPAETVGQIPNATAADVDAAVRAAHAAFLTWRAVPLAQRSALLLKAAEDLGAIVSDSAVLLTREMGKIIAESTADAGGAEFLLRNTVALAEGALAASVRSDEFGTVTVTPAPVGVVAAIVPWNWPIGLMMTKVAAAVVAGDTVVCLPSPVASLAVTRMLSAVAAALPPGVVNVLTGLGIEAGAALTNHPLVRAVSFTGGTETGKAVLTAAASTVKVPMLELGGNDPAILLDDVAVTDELARAIVGASMVTSGQVCLAVKRVYAARQVFAAVTEAVCDMLSTAVISHGLDPASTLGPLASGPQLARAQAMLAEAERRGATVRQLGRYGESFDPAGYYMMPRIITGVDESFAVVSLEQFAPLLPILPFDGEVEAIRRANDTEFGLSASVWSADSARARQVAAQIEAGTVFINQHGPAVVDITMPMGGWKQSGLGREQGPQGFAPYVELRQINDRHVPVPA
jgi:acyl-CoA reductase-like NAD-dependent aldehyde dehydrogenase